MSKRYERPAGVVRFTLYGHGLIERYSYGWCGPDVDASPVWTYERRADERDVVILDVAERDADWVQEQLEADDAVEEYRVERDTIAKAEGK
jgi:hypothetical protein